jgi:hypothetical protein
MITRLMLNLRDPALMTVSGSSARTRVGFRVSQSQNLSTLADSEMNFTEFDHGRSEHNALEGDIELTAVTRHDPRLHILTPSR